MKIAIIGGGASGVALAKMLTSSNHTVTIYERFNSLLKKVKMSGNGRGNVSNINMDAKMYNDPTFAKNIISLLDLKKLEEVLGVNLKEDEEGRLYPYFEKTQIIYDGLTSDLKCHINYNSEVKEITIVDQQYKIKDDYYDVIVLALGSEAGLTKDNYFSLNNINLVNNLGHHLTKLYPSLSPLYLEERMPLLNGRKVKGSVSLIINDEKYTSSGEILFKNDSLSGIAIFELSSIYARKKVKNEKITKANLSVDLFPNLSDDELFKMLLKRYKNSKTPFKGLLEDEVVQYLKSRCNLTNINQTVNLLKNLTFKIDLDKNSDIYQVISGGIALNEVTIDLESKIHKNLFIMGEMLDVDGRCGGYNLHFAFSSAYKVYLKLKGMK